MAQQNEDPIAQAARGHLDGFQDGVTPLIDRLVQEIIAARTQFKTDAAMIDSRFSVGELDALEVERQKEALSSALDAKIAEHVELCRTEGRAFLDVLLSELSLNAETYVVTGTV